MRLRGPSRVMLQGLEPFGLTGLKGLGLVFRKMLRSKSLLAPLKETYVDISFRQS